MNPAVAPGVGPLHQLHPSHPHILASFLSTFLFVNLFSVHQERGDFLPFPHKQAAG